VQAVVDDVAEVQPFWAQLSLADRARYLRKAADVLVDEIDEVADLLSREQGKPLTESYTMEIVPTIDVLHWCADAGPKILADEPIRMGQVLFLSKKAKFSYEPHGVAGVIAPWNYPWSIPFDEVAMALMAGNGVVLKPASLTPLLGERIRETFEKAGLPEGLVRVVHGGGAVGGALCESSAQKIFFTGSVEVGRKVGEICAARLKGSVLELGGKDPQIVCADADLGNAISGCVWGGFANAGQTCSGIERTYVVREVADRFVEGVVRRASELTVGDPMEWETEIGPMVSEDQFGVVTELVDDALEAGAERVAGGPREIPGFSGKFIAPTVLAGVEDDMRIMTEEIFGPVVPIIVPTTPTSASAPRSGRRTAQRGSGWLGGSSPGWCGSTTTPTPTAPASARGAGSRNPAWAAPTRSSASTSAWTSSSSRGNRGSRAISGGSRTTAPWVRRCAHRPACCTGAMASGCAPCARGVCP
jgi:succinate-semialdehyde dehydrogenase/glutarate-semialdehyde dehydrogenase